VARLGVDVEKSQIYYNGVKYQKVAFFFVFKTLLIHK
jgi:hypothetical protein